MRDARIDQWYQGLPDGWRDVAGEIRALVLERSPLMKEEWKYGTPFFVHRRWLCYLGMQQGALVLGFVQGVAMSDPEGLFSASGHRRIRHHRPTPSEKDLRRSALRQALDEAISINDDLGRRGRGPRS
jgi:hypothetical protein